MTALVERVDARALRALERRRRRGDDVMSARHAPWMLGGDQRATPWAQGEAFTPRNLSGLVLWLRADMGITIDGSAVSAWADQATGRAYVQSTAAAQPTLTASTPSGRPDVTSNGAQYLTDSAAWSGGVPQTIVVAAKAQVLTGNTEPVIGSSGAPGIMLSPGSPNEWACDGNGVLGGTAPATAGAYVVLAARYSSTATGNQPATLFLNGTAGTTASADVVQPGTYGVFWRNDGFTTRVLEGSIAEIIAYSRQLTASELQQVTAYMGSRYGIAVA